jgi:hypothetical protein
MAVSSSEGKLERATPAVAQGSTGHASSCKRVPGCLTLCLISQCRGRLQSHAHQMQATSSLQTAVQRAHVTRPHDALSKSVELLA